MSSLQVTPLTGTLGAEVGGVDLRDADERTADEIRSILLQYRVVFFRGQPLTAAELVKLGLHFGELTPAHPITPGLDDQPEVLVLDTVEQPATVSKRDRNAGQYKWHPDVPFVQTPPMGSLLNAQVIPERGGDTQWADLVDAYETLSPPLRDIVDGLEAVHDARRVFTSEAKADSTGRAKARLDALPPVRHPVVRVHPETGERALFVNPRFTVRLHGFAPIESETILGLLYDHIAQPERIVRWHWHEGDLAFWDNRATAHYAIADYGTQHRRMQRITIAGDRPYGPRDLTPELAGAAADS